VAAVARGVLVCALVSFGASEVARAEGECADTGQAVQLATNAFEYRDFGQVVEVLKPCLHPSVRVADPKQRITARRLLGISLHVLGDTAGAKEEFAQLLQDDPQHVLDKAAVPPKVVATFETVRAEMKETLDRILKERGQRVDPDEPKKTVLVAVPPRWTLFAPFGVPQLSMDETSLGVVLGGIQAATLGANIVAWRLAVDAQRGGSAYTQLTVLQYGMLAGFLATWVVSALLGNKSFDERQAAIEAKQGASTRSAKESLSFGVTPIDRGLGLTLGMGAF
jgi:hypothetical protein